ncbi:prostatic spermine-binding protein [Folsomia candida]|nr:prostatic spermine-binding protein [Folsomia candida]
MTVIVVDESTAIKLVSMYYKLEELIEELQDAKDDVGLSYENENVISDDLEYMIQTAYELLEAISIPLNATASGITWDLTDEEDEDSLDDLDDEDDEFGDDDMDEDEDNEEGDDDHHEDEDDFESDMDGFQSLGSLDELSITDEGALEELINFTDGDELEVVMESQLI